MSRGSRVRRRTWRWFRCTCWTNQNDPGDTFLLEQSIKIGIGKTATAPVLGGEQVARARGEFGKSLATPAIFREGLLLVAAELVRIGMIPALKVRWHGAASKQWVRAYQLV